MITYVRAGVYVGSAVDAEDTDVIADNDISHVVTLAEPALPTTTTFHPLTDGENPQPVFDEAVDIVRTHLNDDGQCLVHCRMGRSRAPTVLATALAAEQGESVHDGLDQIHDTERFIAPNQKLLQQASAYLSD